MILRPRVAPGAALVAAFVVGLGACASTDSGPGPEATVAAVYSELIEQAEAGGAGDAQLEALREAERTGELSFETVNGLVQESLDCMAGAGISSEWWEPSEPVPGYKAPAYSFSATADGMTEDQTLAIADGCLYEHSYWAEMGRRDPRAFREEFDEQLREELPRVLECLTEHGVEVDDDATLDEIRQASAELSIETIEATDGEGEVACTDQQPLEWR